MAYDTLNPLGSKDPRDLYDNAENFDKYGNGPNPFYPNRFGIQKLSIEGMNQAFNSAQSGRQTLFETQLAAMGYTWLADYGPGLIFTSRNQYTVRDGLAYTVANSTTLPYTTTGNWATEVSKFKAVSIDDILRADLAKVTGASLIGLTAPDGLAANAQDIFNGIIFRNLTVTVPTDKPTLNAAMDYLRGYTIAAGAVVTVQVLNGTYTLASTVNLNHAQGSKIRMIGNQTDPSLCVLTVADAATFDAVVCSNGNTFGFIDGFTITRPTKAEMPKNSTALLAVNGANIICGTKMRANNWFYGIAARTKSFTACPGAVVTNAGDVGILAFEHSAVSCDGAVSNGASAVGNPWGFGFQAEFGSLLSGAGISATGCKIAGIAALSNSTLRVHDAISNGNVGSGFFARDDGVIDSQGTSSATGNGGYGIEIVEGRGYINTVATNTGNTLGAANPFPVMSVVSGTARFSSSSGPLRLDSTGANPIFFNTGGGLQLEVLDTPSAVNHPYLAGSVAGAPIRLGATGSDTNVDVHLSPRGTGVVRFGTLTAQADAPVTGYITIKDAAGTTRKLAVIG